MPRIRLLDSCYIAALSAFCALPAAHAQQTLSKYTALVRPLGSNKNFDSLKHGASGNLAEVQMQCVPRLYYSRAEHKPDLLQRAGVDITHGYTIADSACFIDKHYRVWLAPMADNPHRCVVRDVPAEVVKGCFQPRRPQ